MKINLYLQVYIKVYIYPFIYVSTNDEGTYIYQGIS